MAKCPIPKSLAAATKLLEEYANLDARIAAVEQDRALAIAKANQWADTAAGPMIEARDRIAAAVESWWPHAAPLIAAGKKSVELGGCMVGSRTARARLGHSFENDDKAVEALQKTRYLRQTTKVKHSLDRTATLKLLQLKGKIGTALQAIGFKIDEPGDQFFVERVQQAATIGQ
jgi:hypothetical protein